MCECVGPCDGTTDNLVSPNVLNMRFPAVHPGTALQEGRFSTDHRKRFRSLDALCATATAGLVSQQLELQHTQEPVFGSGWAGFHVVHLLGNWFSF